MGTSVITITHDESTATMQDRLYSSAGPKVTAQKLENFCMGLMGGSRNAKLDIQVNGGDAVAATGTITITHANVSNNDTVTIGGVTFTAKTSGATGDQFNIGADATADAAALVVAINASSNTANKFTATSALGVVTITSAIKGVIGNCIGLSTSDATAFAVSATTLTSGAEPTANAYKFGYA